MDRESFVFQDASRRRWPWIKRLGFIFAVFLLIATAFFIQSLLTPAPLKNSETLAQLKGEIRAMQNAPAQTLPTRNDNILRRHLAMKRSPRAAEAGAGAPRTQIRAALLPDGDARAWESLHKNGAQLTHILVEGLHVTDSDGSLEVSEEIPIPDNPAWKVFLLLDNDSGGVSIPEGVENLAQAPKETRDKFVSRLAQELKILHATGVAVHWSEIDPGQRGEITALVAEIATGLKERGFETWLCLEMDNDFDCYDLDALSPAIGQFVALLDDENGGAKEPGPVASQDWFDGWLQVAQRYGSPGQWIVAIGCSGYDWSDAAQEPEKITFADAMSRAAQASVDGLTVGAPYFNGTFSYFDQGETHTVWFTDATSFINQYGAVRDQNFGGFLLTPLGAEDAGIWKLIAADVKGKNPRHALDDLHHIKIDNTIPSLGRGEIVGLSDATTPGERQFSMTEDDRISSVYASLPQAPTLFHGGSGGPHRVAITFDDGPDPEWTPQILDILKEHGVHATFFMIGREMEDHPELVERVLEEGHDIGNHTFTHPNLATVPDARIQLELNATQRLLESLTGRSTTLFRPPYNADSRPTDLAERNAIRVAQSLGYTTVLENIDPRDWQTPGTSVLIERVKASRGDGSILLLHDGGGDRRQTVEALPAILDYLKERGDEIVPISDLMGVTRDAVMPPLPSNQPGVPTFASRVGFLSLHLLQDFLRTFLLIASILVAVRTLLVIFLAWLHQRRPAVPADFHPPVSVIIPAYNEEAVIEGTVRSILDSDYPGPMEVIVVDDGSTDGTSERVEAMRDERVRLLRCVNGGKARALQRGTEAATHEFLVFLDGDTQFDRAAIRNLLAPFVDEKVGAVSGHARVGNRRRFIARCQDLEYICGFHLDRRAYAVWNCITVVPGAISAFRTAAVREAGGFSMDTLAEDTDLTLAVHRAGYQVCYQSNAIAYTEAPESIRTLAKQRFRWAYGTLQCVWKHRDMLFNPRFRALGSFSLPGIWFFQVILVAFAPIIDLLFLQSVLMGNAWEILPYFVVFLAADLVLALAALKMEGRRWRDAWVIIPQRFIYRPLLSYVIWKSIVHALRGAWVGWGKLQRTASVSVP